MSVVRRALRPGLDDCGDAERIADGTRADAMMALLRGNEARLTVEGFTGERNREAARAILDGTQNGHSLNVAESTLTELAEQMLWAAGGSEEIVRL
jgi:hypothetical protein